MSMLQHARIQKYNNTCARIGVKVINGRAVPQRKNPVGSLGELGMAEPLVPPMGFFREVMEAALRISGSALRFDQIDENMKRSMQIMTCCTCAREERRHMT
eukprot:4130650-Amphidinium_carterae.1